MSLGMLEPVMRLIWHTWILIRAPSFLLSMEQLFSISSGIRAQGTVLWLQQEGHRSSSTYQDHGVQKPILQVTMLRPKKTAGLAKVTQC
jgi:hypothetical protein